MLGLGGVLMMLAFGGVLILLAGGILMMLALPVMLLLRARSGRGRAQRVSGVDDEVTVTKVRRHGVARDPDFHPRMLLRMSPVANRHLLRVLARGCRAEIERAHAGQRCRSKSGTGHERRHAGKEET